ncbi:protein rough sheath 2 homolog [Durio zibethinus]|uniref:Protein rough sheath 2 homolog n=1 Tax=Durio zibethinus TaxID=66656 RepID=A0A6P6A5C2_DURZI|nr:protein rough sheath 2 homolog [Durio zibethinus]
MKERQRWQPGEDALLKAYVKQYGPKEWNLISQRMGKPLNRDPKSCLERWKNYLKPGIKKGSLTLEEQSLVISLQAKYGNKWKKIAGEVPGRTPKRLGKWWEVFKEKQLKQLQKNQGRIEFSPEGTSSTITPPASSSPGQYDHILETFAEKYVQPNNNFFANYSTINLSPIMPPTISLPDPDPVLSLGSGSSGTARTSSSVVLPLWMNHNHPSSLSSSTSSTTPSPSVSLSLSPGEAGLDPDLIRFMPGQVSTMVQYCKELEEGRQSWMQHKKEATWRLSRLEQQLESEKARKRREKMEEIESKIRSLREEEMAFLGRIESECKEQWNVLQRDAETKETKLMEAWCSKHVKLAKLMEQIGCSAQSPP